MPYCPTDDRPPTDDPPWASVSWPPSPWWPVAYQAGSTRRRGGPGGPDPCRRQRHGGESASRYPVAPEKWVRRSVLGDGRGHGGHRGWIPRAATWPMPWGWGWTRTPSKPGSMNGLPPGVRCPPRPWTAARWVASGSWGPGPARAGSPWPTGVATAGPLSHGTVEDGCVTCPWYGSRFQLATGLPVRGPASIPSPPMSTVSPGTN